MPETISVEGFVRSVSESGLLSEADLRATINGLGGEAGVSDARSSPAAWSTPGG